VIGGRGGLGLGEQGADDQERSHRHCRDQRFFHEM